MAADAVITTDRLILRRLVPADAPRIAALCADREIAANTLTIPHPYALTDAEAWLRGEGDRWASGASANFAMTMGADGLVVGSVGLRIEADHNRAELGYWVARSHWGQGLATEAARAVMEWGFRERGLERVYASHYARNPASGRVLEKIGMRREGVARHAVKKWGAFEDCVIYAMLRADRQVGG